MISFFYRVRQVVPGAPGNVSIYGQLKIHEVFEAHFPDQTFPYSDYARH